MAPFSERFAVAIDMPIECGSCQPKKVCMCMRQVNTHSSGCQMRLVKVAFSVHTARKLKTEESAHNSVFEISFKTTKAQQATILKNSNHPLGEHKRVMRWKEKERILVRTLTETTRANGLTSAIECLVLY